RFRGIEIPIRDLEWALEQHALRATTRSYLESDSRPVARKLLWDRYRSEGLFAGWKGPFVFERDLHRRFHESGAREIHELHGGGFDGRYTIRVEVDDADNATVFVDGATRRTRAICRREWRSTLEFLERYRVADLPAIGDPGAGRNYIYYHVSAAGGQRTGFHLTADWPQSALYHLLVRRFERHALISPSRRPDTDPRRELLQCIGDINDATRPRPLVNLELFFEGNSDPASIGYNLEDPPTPSEFYALLQELRERADVHNVLIEVKDIEDPDGWPSSDTIWFITTADSATVEDWFPKRLAPDEMIEGFKTGAGKKAEPCEIPEGLRAIAAWYD
ncbi:MAG: hypothetical protein V3T86_08375, partial [Planctomycetota bacterium]